MMSLSNFCKNNRGPMLVAAVKTINFRFHGRKGLAIMLSRINCWVGFGRTGYPFIFAMKVDEGKNICRTDSAAHLLSTPRVVGSAGERSRARQSGLGKI